MVALFAVRTCEPSKLSVTRMTHTLSASRKIYVPKNYVYMYALVVAVAVPFGCEKRKQQ